jgi:hypothetical protein
MIERLVDKYLSESISAKRMIGDKRVEVSGTEIRVNGRVVGALRREMRYGYHPVVEVTVNGKREWIDLDKLFANKHQALWAALERMIK